MLYQNNSTQLQQKISNNNYPFEYLQNNKSRVRDLDITASQVSMDFLNNGGPRIQNFISANGSYVELESGDQIPMFDFKPEHFTQI